jgi:nickel transport protein
MINISAFAHKVNIFAYVEGKKIYTESYFNDGKKCIDSKIEVFDNRENKLLEGLTDKEGEFSFEVPPEDVDLKIVLTASMGHRAEYSISADELRGAAGLIKEEPEEPVSVISPETSLVDLKENRLHNWYFWNCSLFFKP